MNQLRDQVEEVLPTKDMKLGRIVLEEVESLYVQITFIYQLINFVRRHNDNFGSYSWFDSNKARVLLNQGLTQIGESPNVEDLHPIVIALINLLPEEEQGDNDTLKI